MVLLPIDGVIEDPRSGCRREPNITEILSDPMVQAVMVADGIDPEVLEAELWSMAEKIRNAKIVTLQNPMQGGHGFRRKADSNPMMANSR